LTSSEHILCIGAHAADMEFAAGAVAAKYTRAGHRATFLHLTLGERGHRTLSAAEYAEQKKVEATQAAEILGAKARWFDIPDGELLADEATRRRIAVVLREEQPTILVAHWGGSIHKDHVAAHALIDDARFYACLRTIDLPGGLPAAPHGRIYYAENWEDPYGFEPQVYVNTTDVHEQWLAACERYEIFRRPEGTRGASFRYRDYYVALTICRGALAGFPHAVALMRPRGLIQAKGELLP
jgi:LmbE family N-acetylglucosaminyl deacetylase